MKLTNLTTNETVNLGHDLYWVDEYLNYDIDEREERLANGTLYIAQQKKIEGRPLTLSSAQRHNWLPKHLVNKLYQWANTPKLLLKLNMDSVIDSRIITVSFRLNEPPAIDCSPVVDAKPLSNETEYNVTLKFRIHSIEGS